tara:strand:+ start:94236 stop:95330 length:1095 start_codon:yes stop_codon:yes gene_type:complete
MALTLDGDQKKLILQYWEDQEKEGKTPTIAEIAKYVFNNENLPGNSKEGRCVRDFLASQSLSAKSVHRYKKDEISLSDAQKLFIKNNAKTMKCLEMAKMVFKNYKITALHRECKLVSSYLRELAESDVELYESLNDIPSGNGYKPPPTDINTLTRINKCVNTNLEYKSLTPKQRRDLTSLRKYLHTPRFLSNMENLEEAKDRNLLESQFIRGAYDKFDLTEEEVDQYIILSIEAVNEKNLRQQAEIFRKKLRGLSEDPDSSISMVLINSIKSVEDQTNQCITRQDKMFKALVQDRRGKEESRVSSAQSLLNLVGLMAEEETRKQLLELGKEREIEVEGEIDRIKSVDEIKLRIIGATVNQSKYG